MPCHRIVLTVVLAVASIGSTRAAKDAPEPQPAVLFCPFAKPGRSLDFDYLQQLREAGFTVDYLDRWTDFTWDRISTYNALFMFGFPYEYRGAVRRPMSLPLEGPGHEETMTLVKRYLGQGGGILLNLSFLGSNRAEFDTHRRAMQQFGADLPLELIKVSPVHEAPHPRLRGTPFLYTEQVADTPVSDGVEAIWWPNPQRGLVDYHRYSAPIEVDERWQVVVRAPAGSRTYPFVPRAFDEIPERKRFIDVLVRPDGVEEPPLFAIRDNVEDAGRLALFYCRPVFHVGSGTSWLHNGAMLDKGLGRHRSDFARLLENTFRYLAQPSMTSSTLGGAEVPAERVLPPVLAKRPDTFHDPAKDKAVRARLSPDDAPEAVNVYRGLIGARTAHSGGSGSVADYARAARENGLDFVVFLEAFAELTAEELEQLTADCEQHSDESVLLLPGYRVRANTGNRMLFYGKQPLYPHEKVMSKRAPKTYMLQGETPEGDLTAKNVAGLIFQIKDFMGKQLASVNNIGFFDFRRTGEQGAMQMHHCKGFGAAAVVFYEAGKLVEDVKEQYLRTNAGCMTCVPLSVDLVDSPEELATAVRAGHALNHAIAPSLPEVVGALNKNHQFEGPPVSVSSGPVIRLWSGMSRPFIYGEECFANGKGLMAPDLHVTSETGLKEVALYQGERLFRRFVPENAHDFHVRLFLSALMQNNISVIATDVNGGQAVSYPRQSRKAGEQQQISYCGDHVNEGYATRMARGINGWPVNRYPEISAAGTTWDGGPKAIAPVVRFERFQPDMADADGVKQSHTYQYPELLFADEGVYCGRSVLSGTTEFGGNPWRAWGPIVRPALYEGYSVVTEFGQYSDGVDPTAWGGPGMRRGSLTFLYQQRLTFLKDTTLTQFRLSHYKTAPEVEAVLLTGRGTDLHDAYDLTPGEGKGAQRTVRIPTGSWFSGVSGEMANAFLAFNRAASLTLDVLTRDFRVSVELPKDGMRVTAGQTHQVELVTITWPLDVPLRDSRDVLEVIDYLQDPDGVEVVRGKRTDGPSLGLLELEAADGVCELRIPDPRRQGRRDMPEVSPAVRLHGLNPRWSAGLYQLRGFSGKQFYSNGRKVYRPLGVEPDGRSAFPLYPHRARETHVVAGHPVVAEGPDADRLFIQVTPLTDPGHGGKPPLWHVSVNNPADRAITARMVQAMNLPGLRVKTGDITLKPGGYLRVVHPEVAD